MTVFPETVWPDAELLVLGFLRGHLPGTRLLTDLPANLEKLIREDDTNVVQVTRIGGSSTFRLDYARVDVDAYAGTRADAANLAGQVRTLLPTMRNQELSGAVVVAVREEVGPSWRPDYNTQVRRFGGTWQVVFRPA